MNEMSEKDFLQWIHDRIEHQYGESHNVDFLHRLRKIIESRPTPPASEPSEQPVAEDAEDVVRNSLPISLAMTADFRERLAQVLAQPIREYARHASARAVEANESKLAQIADCINTELRESGGSEIQSYLRDDFRPYIQNLVDLNRARVDGAVEAERQRLARLVDEKIDDVRHHPELKDFDYGYAAALKQVKAWLAGEGENA